MPGLVDLSWILHFVAESFHVISVTNETITMSDVDTDESAETTAQHEEVCLTQWKYIVGECSAILTHACTHTYFTEINPSR